MSRPPSHEDAQLILRLYELRREPRMRQAREWFARRFRADTPEELAALCPPGSEENVSYQMVTGYWEMAASFITQEILHRELFFDSGWELLMVWEKLRRLVPAVRESRKNRSLHRHLQEVGEAYADWVSARAPEFYAEYVEQVRRVDAEEGAAANQGDEQ